jgi:sulfur transfer protein SufE
MVAMDFHLRVDSDGRAERGRAKIVATRWNRKTAHEIRVIADRWSERCAELMPAMTRRRWLTIIAMHRGRVLNLKLGEKLADYL